LGSEASDRDDGGADEADDDADVDDDDDEDDDDNDDDDADDDDDVGDVGAARTSDVSTGASSSPPNCRCRAARSGAVRTAVSLCSTVSV
jgi:ribonuclease E